MNREDQAVKHANDSRLAGGPATVFEWPSARDGSWPMVQTAIVSEYNETDGTWCIRYLATGSYPFKEHRRLPP